VKVEVPPFSGDSAYLAVQKQVDFGPRVPGTAAHAKCADWLKAEFERYGLQASFQIGEALGRNGQRLPIKNIIALYNPQATNRILLCAHWDTRYIADQDKERMQEPILGADDGGSGVGVLLEIARLIGKQSLNIGVDIVLFDTEDQGESGDDPKRPYRPETWCLGSQFWSKTPHVPNYTAKFGILLDMVGSKGANFPKEGLSMRYAGVYVDKVWAMAAKLGYSELFTGPTERQITDDHLFVNEIRRIPTLDIINLPANSATGFGHYWHTHKDNMSVIDKFTLQAVGNTVLHVLHYEAAGAF
jgi:hypothetical protein